MKHSINLHDVATCLKPILSKIGVDIADDRIIDALWRSALSDHFFGRSLVDFTQRTIRSSSAIKDGTSLAKAAKRLEKMFGEFSQDQDISDPMREELDRLLSSMAPSPGRFLSIISESPALTDPDLSDDLKSRYVGNTNVALEIEQLIKFEAALVLRPVVVDLLSRWLDGRVPSVVEECFLALPDKVNYDEGFLSLWDDYCKPDNERFDIGYVTKGVMLDTIFFEDSHPLFHRKEYLWRNTHAILLMFEWDTAAPWLLFRAGRDAVDFARIKAACSEARIEFEKRRANGE